MTQFLQMVSRLAVAAFVVGFCALRTTAATLYWAPGGIIGGTGTWDTATTPNWSTSSGGGSAGLWNQVGGQDIADISFTAINQTVTISGTVNANQVNITSPATGNPNDRITGGTLNLTGAAIVNLKWVVDSPNQWITLATSITGSNGLTVTGKGSLELGGTNSYTGTTTLNNGRTVDLISSTAIPAASILNLQSVTTRVRPGVQATAAGLEGSGSLQAQGGGTDPTQRTLTLSRNDGGTSTYTGAWSGTNAPISIAKQGNYTQILGGTAANNNPGTLTVGAGTLALAKTAGVDAVPNALISISGGTLRLDADNQINNAADLTLSSGTFALNGFDEALDVLTLSADSVIDFGSGTSILTFASGLRTGGTLSLQNWSGSRLGGGADQLRFTANPTALLPYIRFAHKPGAVASAINFGSYYEVVLPEPASLALLGLAGLLGLRRRPAKA